MSIKSPNQSTKDTILAFIGCYAAWIALSALGVWLLFAVRAAMLAIARDTLTNAYVVGNVDRWGTVILGLIWLAFCIGLESWLRFAVGKHRLIHRIVQVLVIEIAILAIAYIVRAIIT